jgi:outer membrane protein, heavy metal efflux system
MPQGAKAVHSLFLLTAMGLAPACAQPVDELVQRALSTNREYLAGAQRVREAEALLRKAGVRPAPSIDVEGGSSTLLGSPGSQDYSVAYSQPFETGGKRSKRIEVARLSVEVAKADADEVKRRLAYEVRQRYAEALNARNRAAVLTDLARANAETLRLLIARVEEGDAAPLEKRLLETDVNRSEVDRVMAETRQQTAILELTRIGAIAAGGTVTDFQLPMPISPADRAELVRRATAERPDLRALRAMEAQAGSGAILARTESAPDVSAAARYSYRSTNFDQFGFNGSGALTPIQDRENVLSFGVSLPLFSARKNQPNIEAAVAREHEARLRREYLEGAIPTEVDAALSRWNAARAAVTVFDQKVLPGAEANLSTIREAWQLGQLRLLDVLAEQRRVLDMRLARVDAEMELLLAWAGLEKAVGGAIR